MLSQMDIKVTRRLLGWEGEQKALSKEAIEASLDLAELRPNTAGWRQFAVRAMSGAGVLSLASGAVFLVAYNWTALGVYGRFATIELPMLAALVFAWIKGLNSMAGRLAILLAVCLIGALVALFGQTYQTGADAYELFFTWALLALPLAAACLWGPSWALWLAVLNIGLILYAGRSPRLAFSESGGISQWMLPFLVDLALFAAVEFLARRRLLGFGDRWLGRCLLAIAMAIGTFILMIRIGYSYSSEPHGGGTIEVLAFAAAFAGLFAYANWRGEDLFPITVLGLSLIVVTTTWIIRIMADREAGISSLLFIALYVIGSSAAAVKGILWLGRRWKNEAAQ